ncbi:hypothetical protein GMDG_08251 [Pseudogymnoascus destructans 20631-21]|uniref:Uncharacterized protein n=1 Tax=Pseudogymnoascus destructans (strain ATCC MYA-4855 / 20631-21) TaxID=658429 RepID=L8G2Q0_PSED2|nr:hypothetical protein GMDG_08251 [Pseudogymnoascus destructans 20631-21]
MRYSPVFHLEDFFDRYAAPGASFDGAHASLAEVSLRHPAADEEYRAHNLHAMPAASSHFPDGIAAYPTTATTATGKRKKDAGEGNELPTRLHDSSTNGNNPTSATTDTLPHLDFFNSSSFPITSNGAHPPRDTRGRPCPSAPATVTPSI